MRRKAPGSARACSSRSLSRQWREKSSRVAGGIIPQGETWTWQSKTRIGRAPHCFGVAYRRTMRPRIRGVAVLGLCATMAAAQAPPPSPPARVKETAAKGRMTRERLARFEGPHIAFSRIVHIEQVDLDR